MGTVPNCRDRSQVGNGFKPGAPEDAPEPPEGAINVQQIYDSVRDAMRYCHDNNVTEANFDDEAFKASLSDYVTQADENRFKDVSDIGVEPNTDKAAAPADMPADNAPSHREGQ